MPAKKVTVKLYQGPYFTMEGKKSGYQLTDCEGIVLRCKTIKACQERTTEQIKIELEVGNAVLLHIHDSSGKLVKIVHYAYNKRADEVTVTDQPVPTKAKAKPKAKAKAKTPSKGKTPSKAKTTSKTKKALPAGLKRYQAFAKAARAAGATAAQIKAGWAKAKEGLTAIKDAKAAGAALKKGRSSSAKKKSAPKRSSAVSTGMPKLAGAGKKKAPKARATSKAKTTSKTAKKKRGPTAYNLFVGAYVKKHAAGLGPKDPERQRVFKDATAAWHTITDAKKQKAKTRSGAASVVSSL